MIGLTPKQADFNEVELHWIGQMMKAEKDVPDDFMCVAMVQAIACILAKIEPIITKADASKLVCIGAYLARQRKRELAAEIEAAVKLAAIARGD